MVYPHQVKVKANGQAVLLSLIWILKPFDLQKGWHYFSLSLGFNDTTEMLISQEIDKISRSIIAWCEKIVTISRLLHNL